MKPNEEQNTTKTRQKDHAPIKSTFHRHARSKRETNLEMKRCWQSTRPSKISRNNVSLLLPHGQEPYFFTWSFFFMSLRRNLDKIPSTPKKKKKSFFLPAGVIFFDFFLLFFFGFFDAGKKKKTTNESSATVGADHYRGAGVGGIRLGAHEKGAGPGGSTLRRPSTSSSTSSARGRGRTLISNSSFQLKKNSALVSFVGFSFNSASLPNLRL